MQRLMKINAFMKRVEDSEVALQKAMMENIKLKGIQESQATMIKKLEATLMVERE